MEWFLGFLLGLFADLFRSIFLPASTDRISRIFPALRKRSNVSDNLLTLEIMGRLQELGKDPELAKFADEDSQKFVARLASQQEAFVEVTAEALNSDYMTQTEMNIAAHNSARIASQHMEKALAAMFEPGLLSKTQTDKLRESQEKWMAYAKSKAELASLEAEGGTLAPTLYSSEFEELVISRTGDLKTMKAHLKLLIG